MTTQLEKILAQTRITTTDRKRKTNIPLLERQAANHSPRGFTANLRKAATLGPAIIAELKRASPSKGMLRDIYEPVSIAIGYEGAGAAAISVLTDEPFFKGSLEDLVQVATAVKIPVLRKDFMIDPFQILEARAAGADAILLIVAAHTDPDLLSLADSAHQLDLDILCEVHDAEELKRAIGLGFEVIGVNSRDLKTLEVHPSRHEELIAGMPANVIRVAESGIRNAADVQRLLHVGFDAFLVGETLMRQPDPGAALAMLMEKPYATEA